MMNKGQLKSRRHGRLDGRFEGGKCHILDILLGTPGANPQRLLHAYDERAVLVRNA